MVLYTNYELSNAALIKLSSFLFWSWCYLWCTQGFPRHKPEWYSRMVTLLHGSVASFFGFYQCGLTSLSYSKLTEDNTASQYALMVWSWGYFAFDLMWCLIYTPRDYIILLHHASALVGVNVYMGKENTGCSFPCTVALLEITNPLLQTRWFLRECGHNKTVVYYTVEILYLLMFLALRGVLCTYFMYKIILSDTFGMDQKLISFALYIVSSALVYEIFGYIMYKYEKIIVEFIRCISQ
ncbi:TLC domain-containing protein 5-like [Aricia agestis]|uniref:TLC domain-containing protein 5-like n=1 Tax=Aricia agestis TaxID=91739 RepID=UPI001C207F19|nr:TLC domain-containing protein 5-like [Aricia agestis]XP_041985920.1 TLC domain-containing protein 5-like [Aricia agestis]